MTNATINIKFENLNPFDNFGNDISYYHQSDLTIKFLNVLIDAYNTYVTELKGTNKDPILHKDDIKITNEFRNKYIRSKFLSILDDAGMTSAEVCEMNDEEQVYLFLLGISQYKLPLSYYGTVSFMSLLDIVNDDSMSDVFDELDSILTNGKGFLIMATDKECDYMYSLEDELDNLLLSIKE